MNREQQPVCTCEMCECDPAETTELTEREDAE